MGISTGLAGWTERLLGGKAANFGPDAVKFGQAGADNAVFGRGVTNQGLAGLDELNGTLHDQLANGGLTPAMEQVFGHAQGRVTDEAQRQKNAFAQQIMQTARQSGGSLDPSQAIDAQVENSANVGGSVFAARNQISDSEAQMRMDNTNKILDRIFGIQQAKLGVGSDEEQRAMQQQLAALQLRYQRNAAIASTIVGSTKGISAGGSGGGGGIQ